MTQKSWLWTGTATGDASLAPYTSADFNRWFATSRGLDEDTRVYFLAGYLDSLRIEPVAGTSYSSLVVHPGAALIDNVIYHNDEDLYFSIDALVSYPVTTYYRTDSLVLRLDREAQTARLVLLKSDEATTAVIPSPPTLTQTISGIWEVEIARVIVDSTSFLLDWAHTYLYQDYLPVGPLFSHNPPNLIPNSEWMALDQGFGTAEVLPGGWIDLWDGTQSVTNPLSPQKRGWSYHTANTTVDNYVWVIVSASKELYAGDNVITYEGIIDIANATSALEIIFEFHDNENTVIEDSFSIYLREVDTYHLKQAIIVPEGAKTLHIAYVTRGTDNTLTLGQQIVSPGYFTGGIKSFSSFENYQDLLTDSSWDGDAKSTGTTTIDLSASFNGRVPLHAKAVILHVRAADSGSAGGTPYVEILSYTSATVYGRLELDGVTNSTYRSNQFLVYINEPFATTRATNRGFRVSVSATGAGTLNCYLQIMGIIT